MTADMAREYESEGQFAPGSMLAESTGGNKIRVRSVREKRA